MPAPGPRAGTTATRLESHGTAVSFVGLEPGLAKLVARDDAVHHLQHRRDQLGLCSQQQAQIEGADQLLIYPPVPTSVARVADFERMQVLAEAATRGALQRVLTPWMAALPSLGSQHKTVLRRALDVDPLAIQLPSGPVHTK